MRFRSSAHVDLRRLDELPADQRAAFRDLEGAPDVHALLVPRPPLATTIKAVSRHVAELFAALQEPATLHDVSDEIVELVLDEILEVERAGDFVSGADALTLFSGAEAAPPITRSIEALLYAQDLQTADPQALTIALYRYNTVPLSLFWETSLATEAAVLAYLGADRSPLREILARQWTLSRRRKGWLVWSSGPRRPRGENDVTYKLYVSPRPERMREVFHVVVRILGDLPCARFKIGDSAGGLLRPDKLVSYYGTRDELEAVAEELRRELAGCEAQGVPFTAALDDAGLLSWGVDPPRADRVLQWTDAESWRFWIAQRLGRALAIAKRARTASAAQPMSFALERIRRQGIDVETWTPTNALWSGA